jgi:Domain of unknown function (DUF6484)
MKKEWLNITLEAAPSTHDMHEVEATHLFEVQEDLVPSRPCETHETCKLDGVVIGMLIGLNDMGEPLVDFPANRSTGPLIARSIVVVGNREIGREVVLQFAGGDLGNPIIMGLIQPSQAAQTTAPEVLHSDAQNPVVAEVDGERLVFRAQKEIVLRCGKASITLTQAGKILIRGAYLLNRSSGVNRIKGGSVQIN